MSGELDATRAFITGGGSGIGRAVAHAAEVAAGPGRRLDFGVNSAGASGGDDLEPLADYATSQFDRMIAIDLRGTFLSMKYELRYHADGAVAGDRGGSRSLTDKQTHRLACKKPAQRASTRSLPS
jgi:NAD(P)-dependent dehydrogenase (short-subunit alcohol dehydrogenase family)